MQRTQRQGKSENDLLLIRPDKSADPRSSRAAVTLPSQHESESNRPIDGCRAANLFLKLVQEHSRNQSRF
jgi:hypothetical protein